MVLRHRKPTNVQETVQNVVQESYLEAINDADKEEEQRKLFLRAAFK